MAASPSVVARKTEQAPVLDGRVDEQQWKTAEAASDFLQQWPVQGGPASEKTEVHFIYTDTSIYIGVICYDTEPDRIVDTQSRRDGDLNDSDSILIILDTYHDGQNGFLFGTNPRGIQYDAQVLNEGVAGGQSSSTGGIGRSATSTTQRGNVSAFNLNWDTTWAVASSRTERGWEAEMEIPLNSLRFRNSSEPQSWGVNVMRNIRRKNEQVFWSEIPQAFNIYRVSLAGSLESLDIQPPRNLKFIPYGLVGVQRDFLSSETDLKLEPGFDVKYGVSSAMTLDVTVNTDFAQVEVDDEQINLTRFPLFFPEKRDFFLENAGTFAFGTPREMDLFFSRRIGIEQGFEVPILVGGRLSGKVDRFQVGLLGIQTGKEDGVVAPGQNFFVGRVRREFHKRSSVGFIFTNRESFGDPQGKTEYNRAWGSDLQLGLGENLIVSSYLAKTYTPDVSGDDFAGNVYAGYQSNLWRLNANYTDIQDNFNPEVGFVQRRGRKPQFRIFFNPSPETGPIKRWNPHYGFRRWYGSDGQLETERQHHDLEVFFRNGGSLSIVWNKDFEFLRVPFEIHPGVFIPPGGYHFNQYEVTAASDPSAWLYGDMALGFGSFFDGDIESYDFIVGFRTGPDFVTELNFVNTQVDAPWGRFNTNLGRLRISYSFTPYRFIQALIQYNSRDQVFSSNIRFGWTQPNGTGLYVVYNDGYTTPGETFDPLTRAFFVKYSYQFDF
jgi:hypothetical protein